MIEYHYENPDFSYEFEAVTTAWIQHVVRSHNFEIQEVNYIFCTDDQLLVLNKEHLQHDDYTDILTFDFSLPGTRQLLVDMYISTERVADNAQQLGHTFIDELHRVMVHGILHCIGYNDKDDKQAAIMRKQEDLALSLRMF